MKASDIDKGIKLVDFENFFGVHENETDQRKPYLYNLNETVYFDGVPSNEYKLKHDMFWTTLSYEIYGTTRLWWALMKVNNVGMDRTFEPVYAGETIRYIGKDEIRSILLNIGDIGK